MIAIRVGDILNSFFYEYNGRKNKEEEKISS